MTEQQEITEYQNCLAESLAALCVAMGVEPETYDKDQSDFQNYIDCANDAATLITQLKAMAESGFELASFASYSEIVGGITHNRSAIRAGCDSVYKHRADINEKREDFFQ
jgi:hypothetical protein